MEKRKLNVQNIITIVTFVGSLIGIWRAVELKAFALEKEQESLNKRMEEYSVAHQKMVEQMNDIAKLTEKTATILDQHIKYYNK